MNKYTSSIISLASLLLFVQAGHRSSTERETPDIIFSGKLTDINGKTFNVEEITISGLYDHIPVYHVPKDHKLDPRGNTDTLDLEEIKKITVVSSTPIKYDHREYVTIEVELHDAAHTVDSYLIEKDRRIYSKRPTSAGPTEKKPTIQHIKSLEIIGKPIKRQNKSNKTNTKKEEKKAAIQTINNMETIIQSIDSGEKKDTLMKHLNDLRASLKKIYAR